jgi:hypothetical protein
MSEPSAIDSKLHWTSTDALRPTQCSVGFLEVQLKMQELRQRFARPEELQSYLKGHPIPAVLGPDRRMYLTDHHHMGLALVRLADEWDANDNPAARNPYRSCCIQVVRDDSDRQELTLKQFFATLEEHGLCHPFDGNGRRVDKIPKYLTELVDDPYRSLAGLARKAGAYDKVDIAFTEFKWADYLRDKVDCRLICQEHLASAIYQAIVLANDPQAANLPGYHGGKPLSDLPTQSDISERLSKRHGADDSAPGLPIVRVAKHASW